MSQTRFGVVGNPIKHSKSPFIHSEFAKQTGISLCYDALLAPIDGFEAFVSDFFRQGGSGLNVTVPFKEFAFNLAKNKSARAVRAGAANTLWQDDNGELCADNTDGLGLLQDITVNHNESLANKRILILGAGGAVRGIIAPLLETQPISIHIANRTAQKAAILGELFSDIATIGTSGWDGLQGLSFDWIINGTSASLDGQLPPLPHGILAAGGSTYDMMYSKEPTIFQQWSNQNGAKSAIDGLGMLVEQAAESFFIWNGVRPSTSSLIKQLRS